MKKKKPIFLFPVLLSATTACISSGCANNLHAPDAPTNAAGAVTIPDFVLTYAENQSIDYPTTQGAYRFANLVSQKTDGRIEIQINPDGTLGDEKSVIEQLQFGAIDFARISLSPLSEFVPSLNVLQMPYIYKNRDHMWRVLDGEIGEKFLNSFDGSNLVALSWYDAGARSFYNSERPITCLEDMSGLKLRVQESELMSEMIRALGAVPTQMAYNEVYSGIQTGVIDGAENNFPSYESTGHYKVAPYFTQDEHTRVPELQLCSSVTWEKIPSEDQDLIRDAAKESALYERALWAGREKIAERTVRNNGVEITTLPESEKLRFQDAMAPVYEEFCSEYVDIVQKIIESGDDE